MLTLSSGITILFDGFIIRIRIILDIMLVAIKIRASF